MYIVLSISRLIYYTRITGIILHHWGFNIFLVHVPVYFDTCSRPPVLVVTKGLQ